MIHRKRTPTLAALCYRCLLIAISAIMDPLSLTASIIAVLGAASAAAQGLEKLRSIRHAPQQVLVVLSEVSDFRTVIATLQTITDDLGNQKNQDPEIVEHIESLIRKSEALLKKINTFIRAGLIKNLRHVSTDGIKISWRIWIRKQGHMQELSAHLANVRKDISTALTVLIAAEVPRVRIDLQGIAFSNHEIGSSMQELEKSTRSRLESMAEEVSIIQPTLETLQTVLQQLQLTSPEKQAAPPHQGPTARKDAARNTVPSTFRIQTSLRRSCSELCMCHCHKSTNLNSPRWLKGVIGYVFIAYSGAPLAKRRKCTEIACLKEHQSSLKVSYFFPTWFMGRMLVFRDHYSPVDGHSISVKTPRIVDTDANHPAVWAAVHGNVESMRDLFARGLASQLDVDDLGQSLLKIAFGYRQVYVCKLLLESYNDREQEDITARLRSSIDILWNLSLREPSNRLNHELQRVFGHYLDPSENFRKRQFTRIHQIVLGIIPLDLEKQLQTSTAEINDECSMGRTALSWAASHSDASAVRTLLRYGAEIDVVDKTGRNAIYHATSSSGDNTEILEVLLKAAAGMASRRSSYEVRERFQDSLETPIYDAASSFSGVVCEEFDELYEGEVPRILHPSVSMLANQGDNEGWTPLHYAALDDKHCRALVLLSHGAEVETPKSALLFAIQFNAHRVLSPLLSRGARIDAVDEEGQGILHYAAAFADFETLGILEDCGEFSGLERDARDARGDTPLQIWEKSRAGIVGEDDDDEWERCRELFEKILANVTVGKRNNAEVLAYVEDVGVDIFESDNEEDNFFDAEWAADRIQLRAKFKDERLP